LTASSAEGLAEPKPKLLGLPCSARRRPLPVPGRAARAKPHNGRDLYAAGVADKPPTHAAGGDSQLAATHLAEG